MTSRRTGLVVLIAALLALATAISPAAAAPPSDPRPLPDSVVRPLATGTPISNATLLYPRVIRLQVGAAAGQLIASGTTFTGRGGETAVFRSTDGGASFSPLSFIPASQNAGRPGLCCTSIYELPSAVGNLPAGTLIWGGTVGQDSNPKRISIDTWRSLDAGSTWAPLGRVQTSTTAGGLWEPEFSVDAAGTLAVYYAEETSQGGAGPQRIVRFDSANGATWTNRRIIVQTRSGATRPGMPVVRKLPNNTYLMSYEICGRGAVPLDCAGYLRTSADGINWGNASADDLLVRSTAGRHFQAAPNVTWAPDGTPDGRLVYVGQRLLTSGGAVAGGSGGTVMVSDGSAAGPWREVASPVVVPNPTRTPCPNYSSALLAVGSAGAVLELATDVVGGDCRGFFATASTG